ncbi:MAG TPA: hypothetical protein VFL28_15615 [bacterium]|nr:hypothetical protein [bacterium]
MEQRGDSRRREHYDGECERHRGCDAAFGYKPVARFALVLTPAEQHAPECIAAMTAVQGPLAVEPDV